MITGDQTGHHPLRNRTFQTLTRRDRLRLTQGDSRLVANTSAPPRHTLPQSGREGYPVVFLLSSKIGGPEGLAPIPLSGELPCEGMLHRRYSHGVGFQISLRFCVLRNEGFYGGRSANPATNLQIRSNPTAGGRPQTPLGTRYGWPLAHKELLRPLTGFVFNPAGCPYPNTLLTKKNLVGETV